MQTLKLAALAALALAVMGCGSSSDDEQGFADERPGININFVGAAVTSAPAPFAYVPLANTYGGASGQTGIWNEIGLGISTLLGAEGEVLTVTVDSTANQGDIDLAPLTTEDSMLLANYILTSGSLISIELDGLIRGQYELYFYSSRPQAAIIANGVAIALLGGANDQLENDGDNWTSVTVDVGADGTLSIAYIFSGASGLQLIPVN
jgi:hypothetical protein